MENREKTIQNKKFVLARTTRTVYEWYEAYDLMRI